MAPNQFSISGAIAVSMLALDTLIELAIPAVQRRQQEGRVSTNLALTVTRWVAGLPAGGTRNV